RTLLNLRCSNHFTKYVLDSGYSGYSPHRRITLLERLVRTHSVWLQLGLSQQGALTLLQKQPPRSFVVRRSASQRRKVVSVRMDSDSAPVRDFTVTEKRVLEKAMHKLVLKPLKPVLTLALHEASVRSGAWAELRENLNVAKTKMPAEMGVSDAAPPDHVSLEKIRTKLLSISKLYSPEKKVQRLLQVCKLIYAVMEDNSGRLFGADDFLPMLTYVLAQCDVPQLDHEVLYMMELLDPALLNGEGGYYLTSVYGALSLIKNVREEQAERALSSQTRDTLHQWHRRRTMQRTAPSIDDFQNYLRVALQERDSGCTAKTLRVRPQATVEDVCSLCAVKFCVDEPQEYGLFLETDGGRQQLAPDTHPQKIKAELHSRERPAAFHFIYRRGQRFYGGGPDFAPGPDVASPCFRCFR
uniref:Ras and Rab interactor 2 n=1 Tax=Neogobius melanostomus TaxID=47308 RepID=A0A8C6TXG4_9GOBI